MITLQDYFTDPDGRRRDEMYPLRMSPTIQENARLTVNLAGYVLKAFLGRGGSLPMHRNGTHVSSGWRPPEVNAETAGAAVNSKHMTGQAVDLYDPDGDLDEWLMTRSGQRVIEEIGLWMEHPAATKGWCHLQTVPPRSGRRVFYP